MAPRSRLPWCCFLLFCASACAQERQASPLLVSPTIARTAGVDPVSHFAFTRLYLNSDSLDPHAAFDLAHPTLTVQCTLRPTNKYTFELFLNDGGVTDTAFYPPWKPANRDDLFAPPTEKLKVTMEFLGYTHVKPVTRQFELVTEPFGQMRYNPPSSGSSNLEEIAFYFQYLRALPTLRVSWKDHTATFHSEPLLAQIRKEALCRASAL